MKAFPITSEQYLSGKLEEVGGMDLRDYFAANASEKDIERFMSVKIGTAQNKDQHGNYSEVSVYPSREQAKFMYADEMMEARNA